MTRSQPRGQFRAGTEDEVNQTTPHQYQRRLMNEHEAASYLNVSVSTLRRWRADRNGRGPDFLKLGASVRYELAALLEYIATCRQRGGVAL